MRTYTYPVKKTVSVKHMSARVHLMKLLKLESMIYDLSGASNEIIKCMTYEDSSASTHTIKCVTFEDFGIYPMASLKV